MLGFRSLVWGLPKIGGPLLGALIVLVAKKAMTGLCLLVVSGD